MKRLFLLFVVLFFLAGLTTSAKQNVVNLVKVDGVIDPVVARYVLSQIETAEQEKVEALVVQMDTPGGLDISMRTIVKRFLNSEVPIVVYVAPSGARAASAGVFLALASHVVAMAPSTNIGAAHPVSLGGETSGAVEDKAVNDAAAYIKTIAKAKRRNVSWAEDAVRKSVSATEDEALEKNVIEHIAPTLSSLLTKIDGTTLRTAKGKVVLNTRGARVVTKEMTFRQRLLHALADPNLAYILLIIGFYGIVYELANPGFGFAGIGGAISLILALYSFQILPVNFAGLALLVLAFILFVAEALVVSGGLLGAGGAIAFIIGSLILIDTSARELRVSFLLIIPAVAVTAVFTLFVLGAGLRAQRRRVTTGTEGMVGEIGIVWSDLDKEGQVFVHGELWTATAREPIKKGEKVKVVEVKGLKLLVEKFSEG